jgi:integrating conjugative element protein (TIGR03765 family)
MHVVSLIFIALLGLLVSSNAVCEPVVIYDSGLTYPLPSPRKSIQAPFAPPVQPTGTVKRFPVHTPSMSPGRVKTRAINRPYLTQPIFIVGTDRFSYQWLRRNRQQLKKHQAIGIAVNIGNEKQLTQLIKGAGGLRISPVRGQKIAQQLALTHYPVLVSRNGIEQ